MLNPTPEALLSVALDAARLKRVPRSGWQMRGVPSGGQPENVAAHSFGVAFIAMLLLEGTPTLDAAHTLRLALIHDLAESRLGDLPKTILPYLPPDAKQQAEERAMAEIVALLPQGDDWLTLWREYATGESAAAHLVKDADRLDMLLQAYLYEEVGQRNLDDFWVRERESFHYEISRALFDQLVALRARLDERRA